jgi:ATP-dependent RNA helicase DDX54/DBP10
LPSHSVCQKVLVSATLPKVLVEFSKSGFCVDPVVVRLDQEATVSDELRMAFVTCRSTDKDAALLHILHQHIFIEGAGRPKPKDKDKNSFRTGLTLIFTATRHHVDYISVLLRASNLPVTSIYGSMDHQARQQNLLSFRNGQAPILVVTDVAARGIDVPLIDHVIHYHFPASPKLFVHRSGRAARAGRIGYAWAIPEPDELPYVVDLLLFLGRKLASGQDPYSLESMTPEMVHYGCIPELILSSEVENIERIMHSELTGSLESQDLKNLAKVCNNAMKQYKKTRPEASREAAHMAKAVLEGERDVTGQRKKLVPIPPHPLFLAMTAPCTSNSRGLQNLLQERDKFLEAMANFRPKETVFEAFGNGKAQEMSVVGHVDKGRTMAANSGAHACMEAIKNMRRQVKIARDKGHLVVAGTEAASDESEKVLCDGADVSHDTVHQESPELATKRRMSKAERRRLKNDGPAKVEDGAALVDKKSKKRDFRDPNFFMDNDNVSNEAESDRSRRVEAAMQPSSAHAAKASKNQALRMEEAMLEIVGDENEALIKKQRMMRWDKAKRKYVATTIGSELSGESRSKKMRLESGQVVKNSKLKLGELYQKWQKKCNKSIGRSGVFDANDNTEESTPSTTREVKTGSKKKSSAKHDAPRTVASIKKEREKNGQLKLKNMKRSERRKIESRSQEKDDGKRSNVSWKSKKTDRKKR